MKTLDDWLVPKTNDAHELYALLDKQVFNTYVQVHATVHEFRVFLCEFNERLKRLNAVVSDVVSVTERVCNP